MKYAVQAKVVISTPAQQDNLHTGVISLIKDGATWERIVTQKVESEDNKPVHLTLVRFHEKADADSLFDYIKARIVLIPALKGWVTKHLCYHDEGGKVCQITEEFEK